MLCPACVLRGVLETASAAGGAKSAPIAREVLPRSFGPYRLIEEIGRGGMGVVYRAEQPGLGRMVAVKLLLAGAFSSEAMLRRFQLEAATAAGLQHPNIVAIHDYGEVNGQPYYAMDLIIGRNLAELCGGRPLPARRAAEIQRLLASAVHYAHERGVVHRDLKPSNVLIDEKGWPRIADFGLAKRLGATDGATQTGQMIGSPSYAAPEQAAGRPAGSDVTSDIYGLGALFYHLLTGRAPFNAATPTETFRLVLDTDPAPPRLLNPALPRDLETICLKCLAKEPARRYATAAEVADDVDRFLSERPIRARPPDALYRMRKFTRRHRVGVAAVAAGLLALVVGLGFALVGFRRAVVQQRATDAARGQAEHLVGLMTEDLKPALEQRGGLPQLLKMTEEIVRYYEALPTALRRPETERRQAAALEALAQLRGPSLNDRKGAEAAQRAALILREKIAREHPDDPEAAAAKLWDEWQLPSVAGDVEAQRSEARQEAFVRRWQQLHARFPDNLRVQKGLAEVLSIYAQDAAAEWNKPKEGLAAATQCRALVDALAAAPPPDRAWSGLVEKSLQALATAYQALGENAEAVAVSEQALAYCSAALQADPGNLNLRWQTAEAARNLSYKAGALSTRRMRDAELIAREHYRILTELDPGDQQYRFFFAWAHMMEAYYLASTDGHAQNARRALDKFDALLEPFLERKGHEDVWQQRIANRVVFAQVAAASGDADGARAALKETRARLELWRGRLSGYPLEQRLIYLHNADSMAWAAWSLRDWPELTRLARQALGEIEAGLREQPDNAELRLRATMMRCFQGLALHGAGRAAEAIGILKETSDRLRDAPPVFHVDDRPSLRMVASLCCVEALAQSGDTAGARRLGEQILLAAPVAAEVWWVKEWYARVQVTVAGLLDPAELLRRIALLDRAAEFLTSPEAEGRLTVLGRECLARIEKLVAATGPLDPGALAAAGRQLDQTAATDPEAVERITRAGEATWHDGTWVSAVFSPKACAAEKEIRECLQALITREPESRGLRLLHAATYRMECYVHLGLDGMVEPGRAAFLEYDALLAPFASEKGYECVGRTRVENALHLAQLAASAGDGDGARTWMEEAGRRFAAERERLPEGAPEQRLARVQFLEESAWTSWWLRDWAELGRVAQEAKQQIEAGLRERPADEELVLRQAIAACFAALAVSGAGRWTDAVGLLEAADDAIRRAPRVVGVSGYHGVYWATNTALMEALERAGDSRQARHRAESGLANVEMWVPQYPEYWRAQKLQAAIEVLIARMLDPTNLTEAARRKELLDKAATILAPEKTAGRLTVDVRETLAEIERLRASPARANR